MVEVEGQEVHAAWHASVAAQCASRGVSAPPPPPEEAAWFQSGHSRRTEGMREPQPADEARAGPGEGTVLEAVRLPPPSAKPRPAPAQRAAQPVARASPAASPDQRRLLLGVPLAHWLGPCLAALVGVLSMLAISRTNGPQIPTLPATRYFAPSSRVAGYAAKLYSEIKDLPLLCPHGHVDAAIFADTSFRFSDPSSLFITPDHYVLRLLHSQGVALSSLGVSNATGPQESGVSPRQVWRTFAEHQHLFRGTPSSLWLRESLAAAFNVTEKLSGGNAERLYDTIDAALKRDSSRPSVLLDTFNIRLLATTNGATDELAAHAALSRGALRGRVVPTFRPDDVTDVLAPHWLSNLAKLRELTGERIDTFPSFLSALRIRRRAFIALGATASDHGATRPTTLALPAQRAQELFSSALAGGISASEASEFSAHMLVESARMSAQDGLVMQLHAGVVRNHDPQLFARYGADKGGDVPHAVGWTEGLQPLLSELGWHPNLTLVLFTLDESTYSRELAPLAGHYPILRLGPPWWFHDSLNGMRRYLDAVVETAGVANLAGFNDDTRAFLSIPARHTLWRRAVADWAAEQHARGVMDWPDARAVVYDLAYGNAKKTYKLAGQAL